jgi:Zn-dependent peptidase ImmA (M78 family)/DNA-binding XRE family transcriptional regulator
MSKALVVPVRPDVLRWARETIGKTPEEVAKRLHIERITVEAWESGQKNPTLKQIKELAVCLKRPLAAFFLPAPPQEAPLPTDFRSLPMGSKKLFSEKTLLALRRARRLQDLSHELASEEKQSSARIIGSVSSSDDPRSIAEEARRSLGVTVEKQSSWPDDLSALNAWRNAVESRAVLVLELPFPVREGRAFSLSDGEPSTIALNSNDAVTGRIFSLFHEYGHLLLHQSGICDLSEDGKTIEQFCNRFAGELLVPEPSLLRHPSVKGHGTGTTWNEEDLWQIARQFKVSREVILRRLLIIGRITERFYQQKREEWEAQLRTQKRQRGGRSIPARQCVRQNGVPFTTLVIESAWRERITYRDVSDYLSIGLKHLSAVESLVREERARYG